MVTISRLILFKVRPLKIFLIFFSIVSPLRFQGFVNEPSTYAILVIPFFLICINNFKKNKLFSILTFFSILISKSLYRLIYWFSNGFLYYDF